MRFEVVVAAVSAGCTILMLAVVAAVVLAFVG